MPGPGVESVVLAADVTPVDDAFAARLHTVDDAPVTGPRPLAVAPYRLALARRARGNRYAEAVVRGVAVGATVRYTVDVRPTSGPAVTLGPYSVLAVVPSSRAGGRRRRAVRGPRRRGPGVGRARPAGRRAHPRAGRPRRHPRRRVAAGPGAHRRHLALGRLPRRPRQPRGAAAAARLGRRHRDVQRSRPGRRARRVRRRRAAGRGGRRGRPGSRAAAPRALLHPVDQRPARGALRRLHAASHVHAGHDGRRARPLLLAPGGGAR